MNFINELLNQPIVKIGRAGDLCWMLFGSSFKEKNVLGKEVEKGEYSLHLQCPWRIRDMEDSSIKLASGDIYEPRSSIEWNENFNWDVQGNNLFDEKVEHLFSKEKMILVEKISVLEDGDLEMIFSNKFVLECFIAISIKEECWRFFKHGSKKHLIIYGNTKEFE